MPCGPGMVGRVVPAGARRVAPPWRLGRRAALLAAALLALALALLA